MLFTNAVKSCLEIVKNLKQESAPIIESIRTNKLREDYVDEIRKFLIKFDELPLIFDKLPLKDGVPTIPLGESDKIKAMDLMPELIKGLEELAANHKEMIVVMETGMKANAERMLLMNKSKKIFDKFVKKPKQDAKFFDKQC